MGYRSDVYITFHKNLLPFWLAHITDDMSRELETNADEYDFFSKDSDWCTMVFECVKWYGSFNEIKAVEKAIAYFDDHQEGELFQMLRIGEEFDDVESIGWANKFHCTRQVVRS